MMSHRKTECELMDELLSYVGMEDLLSYVSQVTGLTSVLTLFWASLDIPFHEASWSGQTCHEKKRRKRRKVLKWAGIPCAFIAAGC